MKELSVRVIDRKTLSGLDAFEQSLILQKLLKELPVRLIGGKIVPGLAACDQSYVLRTLWNVRDMTGDRPAEEYWDQLVKTTIDHAFLETLLDAFLEFDGPKIEELLHAAPTKLLEVFEHLVFAACARVKDGDAGIYDAGFCVGILTVVGNELLRRIAAGE